LRYREILRIELFDSIRLFRETQRLHRTLFDYPLNVEAIQLEFRSKGSPSAVIKGYAEYHNLQNQQTKSVDSKMLLIHPKYSYKHQDQFPKPKRHSTVQPSPAKSHLKIIPEYKKYKTQTPSILHRRTTDNRTRCLPDRVLPLQPASPELPHRRANVLRKNVRLVPFFLG
jgi:hypothetical protein